MIEKVGHTRGGLEKLGRISEKTYASGEQIDAADDFWNVTSSKPEKVKEDLEEGEIADTDDGEKEDQVVVHDNRKVESNIRKEEMIISDEDLEEGEIVDSDEVGLIKEIELFSDWSKKQDLISQIL